MSGTQTCRWHTSPLRRRNAYILVRNKWCSTPPLDGSYAASGGNGPQCKHCHAEKEEADTHIRWQHVVCGVAQSPVAHQRSTYLSPVFTTHPLGPSQPCAFLLPSMLSHVFSEKRKQKVNKLWLHGKEGLIGEVVPDLELMCDHRNFFWDHTS